MIEGTAVVRTAHRTSEELEFPPAELEKGQMLLQIDGQTIVMWNIRDIAPGVRHLRGVGGTVELNFTLPVSR